MTVESDNAIANAAIRDLLKNLLPGFQPMRSKTKTNHSLYVGCFPCVEEVTSNC